MSRRALVVMAKGAEPGRVKTRLMPHVTAEAAAALQQAFIDDHSRRPWPVHDRWMFASGGPEHSFDVARNGGWIVTPQLGDGLGQRMANAFERVLAGCQAAMMLGTDSPDVPLCWVRHGFDALETGTDVVLGPSFDGGYWTIGLRRADSRLFDGIRWSTSTVFAETLDRIRAIGLRVRVLPPWYDVDTVAELDLLRLHSSAEPVAHRPYRPTETLAWLASHSGRDTTAPGTSDVDHERDLR